MHIKRIQPIGPYQLIGWSFGGVLAFEIARQLIEDSNLVSRVVLIDSYFNHKQASSMALSDTLNQKHKKNINHKYRPKKKFSSLHSEIILFKAGKLENIDEATFQDQLNINDIKEAILMDEYYVTQTSDNHLREYLGDDCNLIIKKLNESHTGWLKNIDDVKFISDSIGS